MFRLVPLVLVVMAVASAHAQAFPIRDRPSPDSLVVLPCPAVTESAAEMVEHFLTSPGSADKREATGTIGVAWEAVRPVTDPAVCARLREMSAAEQYAEYGPYVSSFFEGGGFYFETATLEPPEEGDDWYIGIEFISVLDSAFRFIGGYGG